MKFLAKNHDGFSLVELMVVVGIIGILAAIAVPKLQSFTAKAKRTEARTLLKNLHTVQTAYYAENSLYANVATLGLSYTEAKNYRITGVTLVGSGGSTGPYYVGYANLKAGISLCPGVTGDLWAIGDCPFTEALCAAENNANFQSTVSLGVSPQPQSANINCN